MEGMNKETIAAITIKAMRSAVYDEVAKFLSVTKNELEPVMDYTESEECKMTDGDKKLVADAINNLSGKGLSFIKAIQAILDMADLAVKKLGLPEVTIQTYRKEDGKKKTGKNNDSSKEDGDWTLRKN